MKKASLLGLPALLLVTSAALAQQPEFDLADVHVSTTPRWFVGNYEANNVGQIRGGRYVYRDGVLLSMIAEAYGVTPELVTGGPDWLPLDIYDVIAKVPDGTTPATARVMLQFLLAERFALVVRHEMRPAPRFVLSVGKGGSKLKPAAKSEDSGCKSEMAGPMPTSITSPAQIPNTKLICHNLTSQQIIDNLRQNAGGPINTYLTREVIDQTKLEGAWDFELEFTPIGFVGDKGKDGITLYDAVAKQLGLTLGLKDVPLPAIVIESANRNPTPNSPAVKADLGLTTARFEVASIKPVNPNERIMPSRNGGEMRLVGTLRSLITQAFMITPNAANDVIIGLPKSADSKIWDVTAKFPRVGEGAPVGGGARPFHPRAAW